MIDSPAAILQDFLILNNVFGDPAGSGPPAWPIYVNNLPDRAGVPDNVVGIFDTEGVKDGRIMRTGEIIKHYGVQIRVRSIKNTDGWTKVEAAGAILSTLMQQLASCNGNTYLIWNISQTSPNLYLGLEEGTKRRSLFSINFLCTIVPGAGSVPPPVSTGAIWIVQISDLIIPAFGVSYSNKGAPGAIQLSLPAGGNAGDAIAFFVEAAQKMKIIAPASQTITFGGQTSAPGGFIESSSLGSSLLLRVNTTGDFIAGSAEGNWGIDQ